MRERINQLDQSIINTWFKYDSKTGKLFWKKIPYHRSDLLGCEAGCKWKGKEHKTYYKVVRFQKVLYYAHVLIWIMHHGFIPKDFEPDHIDHNGSNNRLNNLKLVTRLDNQHNLTKRDNNTSGITGVSYCSDRDKWRAQITINRHQINLGSFTDITSAIKARKTVEIKYEFHKNHGK
jgi:hypothetical protein